MSYEGGIREPFIIYWKGHVSKGISLTNPISNVDILPTFASWAHASLPAGRTLDGQNVADLLTGRADRRHYIHQPIYIVNHGNVEAVRFGNALPEHIVEAEESVCALVAGAQANAHDDAVAGRHLAYIKPGCFGAFAGGIHRFRAAVNDVVVECVLAVALRGANAEQSSEIRLIVAEQQPIRGFEVEREGAELGVLRKHCAAALILQ